MAMNSSFHRRRWLGGHRRYNYDVRSRCDPRRFRAQNPTALWLTWKSVITLNGADVSAMTDVLGNHNLAQGTAGNQPLFTGAPAYAGHPSIQFTAANNDQLMKLSVDVAGTGPVTVVTAVKMTVNGAVIGNSAGVASGFTVRSDTRTLQNLGGGGRTFQAAGGALDTTAPHVIAFGQDTGEVNGFAYVDNIAQSITPGGTVGAAPGGTAAIHIGSIDGSVSSSFDWIGAAWFQGFLLPSESIRVSKYFAAEIGVIA